MTEETKSLKRALMRKLQRSTDLGWPISHLGIDRNRLKSRLSVKHVVTYPRQLIGPRTKRKNGTKFKRCWVVTQVKKTAWIRGLLVRVPIIYGVPVSTQISNKVGTKKLWEARYKCKIYSFLPTNHSTNFSNDSRPNDDLYEYLTNVRQSWSNRWPLSDKLQLSR